MTNQYGLNIKQQEFIELYLHDKELRGNGTKCYMRAYGIKDENVAGVSSYDLLRTPKIKQYMDDNNKEMSELLRENRQLIFQAALKQVQKGNAAVINKLLDKELPT